MVLTILEMVVLCMTDTLQLVEVSDGENQPNAQEGEERNGREDSHARAGYSLDDRCAGLVGGWGLDGWARHRQGDGSRSSRG